MVYVVSRELLQSVQQNGLNSLQSVRWFWSEHRTEVFQVYRCVLCMYVFIVTCSLSRSIG